MNGADTTGATVIRRAARGDVPASGAVLAAAFHDDPVTSWLLPDEPTRHRRLGLLFAAFLRHQYLRHGTTDLATDTAGGGITATALWTPPGHWREPAWRDLLGVPAYLRALGRRVAAGSALTATLQGAHPHRPH